MPQFQKTLMSQSTPHTPDSPVLTRLLPRKSTEHNFGMCDSPVAPGEKATDPYVNATGSLTLLLRIERKVDFHVSTWDKAWLPCWNSIGAENQHERSHPWEGHVEETWRARQIRTRGNPWTSSNIYPKTRICLSYYFVPFTNSSDINRELSPTIFLWRKST